MRRKNVKRFVALVLAAALVVSVLPLQNRAVYAASEGEENLTEVPDPYYEFTFDSEVKDGKVQNEGTKTEITAAISGTGTGLGVIDDETRGSKVLNLPGEGLNKGALVLPENMFQDVTEEGFAFSFWIEIDKNANQYSRIFSAAPIELNSDNGSSGWNAPEFTFVAGKEGADDLGEGGAGYHTSIMLPDRKSQLKLVWENQFAKGKWQHVTVSVSPEEYEVYLDGEQISMTYDRNNNKSTILKKLFESDGAVLKSFTHNAIGRSVYSTDNDLKAKMDEFRFYNTALSAEQAKAAYDSYAVSESALQALRDKISEAEAKSISFYTKATYSVLSQAVADGQEGLENPVTEANVQRLVRRIDEALSGLEYCEGVSAETTFTNALLQEETKEAKELIAGGKLSAESERSIQSAVDAALKDLRQAMEQQEYDPALHFDLDPAKSRGDVFHGSTGFLYGVSEVNVPSADMLAALSPKILVQKAADGQQHPSGDGYRLTPYLKSCGVENIQIYLQDYYLEWPYESKGIEDYNTKVKQIISKMTKGKSEEELACYSFVIFNEPNSIWYSGKLTQMCEDWLTVYQTIKSINPALKVAGPNFSYYDGSAYKTFFEFCKENNCLPEYITWHELNKSDLTKFQSHCEQVKGYVKTYYADSGIEPILFVNETVNFDDVGNPGALVNWLSIYDEEDVYASLPYWGLANSMNELAADANKPNGAWWVYRWYAQMTGKKAPLTLENIDDPGAYGRLYGMTSVDEKKSTVYSLFGGQAGGQKVCLENIRSTKMFQDAGEAHVKIYRTKFTGHHGFADETPVEFEGNLAFDGEDLVFTIPDAELMDAYYAVITPATEEGTTKISEYDKNWEQTYEAEDAELIGNAEVFQKTQGTDLARSNRAEVGGMNSEEDGVNFTVEVPQKGRYRLNIYYSSQAPQVNPLTLQYVSSNGQNRAIGALSRHTLTVDGGSPQEIVYDSTVKWGYYNYKTVYLDLSAGKHELRLMYQGESQNGKALNSMLCALLDKIDLAYAPKAEAEICIEPEELAVESGDFEFYVNAPKDGLYRFGSKGSGKAVLSKSRMNYAEDARAESEVSVDWMKLFDVELGEESSDMVWLTAGINRLRLTGDKLVLDSLVFEEVSQATKGNSLEIEAENCQISGTDRQDGYNYLPGSAAVPTVKENAQASGGKVIEGFRGGSDNALTVTVNVPESGDYKLSIYYANNEPAPVMKTQSGKNYVHPYNTDLVERYMQISVNAGTPQTVYFKNTFCWDTFKNTVVDVKLNKGSNQITFTNDNSYKFSSLQDDFTPRLDKFVLAPAQTAAMAMEMSVVEKAQEVPQNTESGTAPIVSNGKEVNPISGIPARLKKVWGNKTFTLKAKAVGRITYKSSNKKVVTVGAKTGKVKIKGCGKAVITVVAAGDDQYQASTKTIAVTVVPRKQKITSLKSKTANTLVVAWKKDKKASGYQIRFSASKKFKAGKTVWVKKNRKTSVKLKKLKAGRRYYVKVRAYKKSGKKKIYGAYSRVKKKKLK